MRKCSNCFTSHGPLKRYMWNTCTTKGKIVQSREGLLCEQCAKSLGGWQVVGQGKLVDAIYALPTSTELPTKEKVDEMFDDINSIIDSRTN